MNQSNSYVLSIDQGTTNTRAIIFNKNGHIISKSSIQLSQYFPHNGWVEHDPNVIWNDVIRVINNAVLLGKITFNQIDAIGITNQRETTIIWDRKTGEVIYNALVWQDRRTSNICTNLKLQNLENDIQKKTGLLIDPYFSATKIGWLLDNIPNARIKADRGELAFGTIDSFLLWRLTKGKVHATDATNASRTMLFNIHSQMWDEELLKLFNIPKSILPAVKNSSDNFGHTDKSIFGIEIPITGIAGDQHSATVGQACFHPGMIKSTYGTGCFMVLNTGKQAIVSNNRLLTIVAYRLNNEVTYGLEGSIFSAGTGTQWLRDNLHFFQHSEDTARISQSVQDTLGVYFVPAFTGLGAPYWDPDARAAILGVTRETNINHIVRAQLESVGYQSLDLLKAMINKEKIHCDFVRVDGGMVANDWLCEFLADILNIPVERPSILDTTALGVAFLAGLQIGWYSNLQEITNIWKARSIFYPIMGEQQRNILYNGWCNAVSKIVHSK